MIYRGESLYDNWPVPAADYAKASSIAFNRGSVPEVIDHCITGYICEDEHDAQFREALWAELFGIRKEQRDILNVCWQRQQLAPMPEND